MTILGHEDSSQHKQNFIADNSIGAKGLDCANEAKKSFASGFTALLTYVPKKIHDENLGVSELRRTSIEMIFALKRVWTNHKS